MATVGDRPTEPSLWVIPILPILGRKEDRSLPAKLSDHNTYIETIMIRHARVDDLPVLRELEQAAGALFRDLGMDAVADDEPPTIADLTRFQQAGRALVAADTRDHPVAYLLIEPVDGYLHIEQVSVHPSHARQGLGRQLLDAADAWAEQHGLAGLTLTTYANVPWNGPYYERLGFRVLADEDMSEGLRSVRAHEAANGLDAWPRITMLRTSPHAVST